MNKKYTRRFLIPFVCWLLKTLNDADIEKEAVAEYLDIFSQSDSSK